MTDFTDGVTPLLITLDELPNLERTLAALAWAERIVVVDSGSTDGTLELLARDRRIELHHRRFDSFAAQCNFGLGLVRTPWVLSLDADYVLTEELVAELGGLSPDEAVAGFRASFTYCIQGKRLRGGLYPPRVVLHRVEGSRYVDAGHGHRVEVGRGAIRDLRGRILHDDRKPLERWLQAQDAYAEREADFLLETPNVDLGIVDRLRKLSWIMPWAALPYTLIVKGCLFDGQAGWVYSIQRAYAEIRIALEIATRRGAPPQR